MAETRPDAGGSEVADHGRRVAAMFGRIAGWYDFLNHALSLGLDVYWRRRLVELARPPEGGVVLDVAAGTLDVSLALARAYPTVQVLASDFALPMLARGKAKIPPELSGRIRTVLADARTLPLPDACCDAATIAFGIRNVLPRSEAFAELVRVLKPGGRLCVLEFGSGQTPIWRGIYNVYLNGVLPLVGRVISGDSGAYAYLARTIREFPVPSELAAEMAAAGFERVGWTPLSSGIVYLHAATKPDASVAAGQ